MNLNISAGKALRFPELYEVKPIIICPVDDYLIYGPENGLQNLRSKLELITSAKPTAILAFYGTVLRNVDLFVRQRYIMNLSASIYETKHSNKIPIHEVETAVRMNASGVAYHINILSEHLPQMIESASLLISKAHSYDIPVCGIVYPRADNNHPDANLDQLKENDNIAYSKLIAHCISLGVDLGFDIIKTQYTGNVDTFRIAVDAAGNVPVVIAGGPLMSKDDAKSLAEEAHKSGARGISFGRNTFGRENPYEFIKDLKYSLKVG